MEKISWTDRVRNEDVSLRVKEQRNILHEIRKRKANWIGHILRRNCLLQRVTEGKIQGGIEVTGRQGSRRRKLLDDLKERRGYSHLKEEALDRTMWTAHFGRGFGPVVRQTTKWMRLVLFQTIAPGTWQAVFSSTLNILNKQKTIMKGKSKGLCQQISTCAPFVERQIPRPYLSPNPRITD